jgi:dehydrogenase/reductase SDR family member 7B
LAMYTNIEVDREIMEVDFFSCVAISKNLLPHLMERNSGHIVVISSVMGIIGTPFRSGYAAAKHALHGYFDSLRAELWKKYKGIRVTLVCPGWVKTSITMNALNGDGTKLNSMDNATARGIEVAVFAEKMLAALQTGRSTIVIGGFKERLAVWLQRFFPELMVRVVRTAAVR